MIFVFSENELFAKKAVEFPWPKHKNNTSTSELIVFVKLISVLPIKSWWTLCILLPALEVLYTKLIVTLKWAVAYAYSRHSDVLEAGQFVRTRVALALYPIALLMFYHTWCYASSY